MHVRKCIACTYINVVVIHVGIVDLITLDSTLQSLYSLSTLLDMYVLSFAGLGLNVIVSLGSCDLIVDGQRSFRNWSGRNLLCGSLKLHFLF